MPFGINPDHKPLQNTNWYVLTMKDTKYTYYTYNTVLITI